MSSYAALESLAACRARTNPVTVVTRLRLDAALYEPAPPRRAGRVGRPRRKGQRLPTLATVADDPTTDWTSVTVADWYGRGERTVEVASATAVWYRGGMPSVPLRWVLLRDPQGAVATQALLSTEPDATPERILAWFVLRWQPEVTFEEARRHLGVETQRQWSEVAIRRTTPALFGLFSLVTLHALQQTEQTPTPVRQAAWYPKRQRVPAAAGASPTRRRWCAANSGPTRVLRCPLATPMS